MNLSLRVVDYDALARPNWTPLENAVPVEGARAGDGFLVRGDFMYMGAAVMEGGVRIYGYKHRLTQLYLNLDADGNAYAYTFVGAPDRGSYSLLDLDAARNAVLAIPDVPVARGPRLGPL